MTQFRNVEQEEAAIQSEAGMVSESVNQLLQTKRALRAFKAQCSTALHNPVTLRSFLRYTQCIWVKNKQYDNNT